MAAKKHESCRIPESNMTNKNTTWVEGACYETDDSISTIDDNVVDFTI